MIARITAGLMIKVGWANGAWMVDGGWWMDELFFV